MFKTKKEWIKYMIQKNYDCDRDIVIENCENFLKANKKDFSEYSEKELKNAEIV